MRKVLSFVLVLTLVLSSFSFAFAADAAAPASLSDVAGNANEDAIQVAFDLGIVTGNPDGTFQPAKAVTRAEFAAMITRALAIPDSALAGYKTSVFKDTNGYGWAVPYLAFCNSKGIMLGDGAGNAMPSKTISVNEAVTMALRAIGYTSNSSELVGTWPANYVTKAQELGLYDSVNKDATGVDKANAAQVIYNVLTAQKVAVNSDGATNVLWDNTAKTIATTLLTAGLDCKAVEDVIMGKDYTYDDCKINIVKNLGAHGTAYVEKSGDKKVVAFTKSDSVALTGSMDGAKFKANDVKYTMPDTFVKATTTIPAIYNGDYQTPVTTTIGAYDTISDNGDVTLNVELSGKTIKTIHSMVAWDATDGDTVSASDLKALDDHDLLTGNLPEDDSDAIDVKGFELVGAASLADIKADSVVYIYEDAAGDIRKVAVGTEVVTGTVDEVDSPDITVNGKTYTFYENHSVGNSVTVASIPEAGDDVKITVDPFGYVYDIDTTSTADSFAVIKGQDTTDPLNNDKVKLYQSDDATKTYYLADSDDMSYSKVGAATTSGMSYSSLTTGALIGYGLNKDGDVDTLNLNVVSASGVAAYLQSAKVLKVGAATFPVNSDAVVFTYDGSSYDLTSVSNLKLGSTNDLKINASMQYVLDKDGNNVVAMVVNATADGKSNDDLYAVVNSLTYKANADGDTVQRVVGFANGAALDKLTDKKARVATTFTTVGAYIFQVDSNGVINNEKAASSGAVATAVGVIQDLNSDNTAVKIGGTWYSLANDAVVYEATTKDSNAKVDEYALSRAGAMRAATNYVAYLYDFNTDDDHEGSEVVVFIKY